MISTQLVEKSGETGQVANAIADVFRRSAVWLIVVSALIATTLALRFRVPINPNGTALINWVLAVLLLASRIWWERAGSQRLADAAGSVALVALGGMACGAIAMLELRFHAPLTDPLLRAWDQSIGVDGLAMVEGMLSAGPWIFSLMAPAYNFTIPIFFASLFALSMLRDRVEVWRAALAFVGTLLTTCIVAAFFPAKGLAVWASSDLLDSLPIDAMRGFWHHFDEFYFGTEPVLRLQVIDGVISFPSFHSIVGFLIFAMWRKHFATRLIAGLFLIVMLLGTLPGGGHYIVDLIAGFAVWRSWHQLTLVLEKKYLVGERSATSNLIVEPA